MALSKFQIVQLALGRLGRGLETVNFETDQSATAKAARTYYSQAVREMLNDFPWPFATIFAKMDLLKDGFSRERRFAYAYPAGALKIRRLFDQAGRHRNDDVQSRLKYKIIETISPTNPPQLVKVILADYPDLWVEYTGDDEVVTDFSAEFTTALMYRLAYYMAPLLTNGDPYKLGPQALQDFQGAYALACANAANEEVQDEPRLGQFIDSRQGPWRSDMAGPWHAFPSAISIENS